MDGDLRSDRREGRLAHATHARFPQDRRPQAICPLSSTLPPHLVAGAILQSILRLPRGAPHMRIARGKIETHRRQTKLGFDDASTSSQQTSGMVSMGFQHESSAGTPPDPGVSNAFRTAVNQSPLRYLDPTRHRHRIRTSGLRHNRAPAYRQHKDPAVLPNWHFRWSKLAPSPAPSKASIKQRPRRRQPKPTSRRPMSVSPRS